MSVSEALTAQLREAQAEFQRTRKRLWLERIRVGLEYRRKLAQVDDGVARSRAGRDEAVRRAVADGASYRQVARAIGLSHSRVQQIVNGS